MRAPTSAGKEARAGWLMTGPALAAIGLFFVVPARRGPPVRVAGLTLSGRRRRGAARWRAGGFYSSMIPLFKPIMAPVLSVR